MPADLGIKHFAKGALKLSRIARVRAFAGLRAAAPLRRALNLPSNETLSPRHGSALQLCQVDAAEDFTRPAPHMPGESALPEALARAQSGVCPATFVAEIEGGRFWSFYGGTAMTRDGRIIHEISKDVWGPRLHTAYTRAALPKPQHLPGRTLSLVTPEAAGNYHHWTIDCLSRAGLALRSGHKLPGFDNVLVKHRDHAYQRESFARLGLSPRQLVRVGENDHYQCDSLVVPSVRDDNTKVNRADMRYVRGLYLPAGPSRESARRRLYVGRRDAAFRRVTNEAGFMPMLRGLGFEEVAMSRMSVAEQAKLFSEAEIVIGPNGSALANLVFANPACRVVEFFAPGWIVPYNWMICANLGLDYTALIGGGPRPGPGEPPRDVKQDIELNIAHLEAALEDALSNTATRNPQSAF